MLEDNEKYQYRTSVYLSDYERELLFKNNMLGKFSEFVRGQIKECFGGEGSLEDAKKNLLARENIIKEEIEKKQSNLHEIREKIKNVDEKIKIELDDKRMLEDLKKINIGEEEIKYLIKSKINNPNLSEITLLKNFCIKFNKKLKSDVFFGILKKINEYVAYKKK